MKYCASFLIIIIFALTACNNSRQISVNNGLSPEVPFEAGAIDSAYVDNADDTEELLLQNIPEILRQAPTLSPWEENYIFLSKNSRVIMAAEGKLDGDRIDDIVIVTEFSAEDEEDFGYVEGEFGFGERHIYVLLGAANGSYTVAHKNKFLILGGHEGGVFGDPLQKVEIDDEVLKIKHYGGSSSRWGYDMHFAYDDGQFALIYMTMYSHSTHTANGESTIYDFANRRIERYVSSSLKNKDYFLYGAELPGKTYLFDDVNLSEIEADCNPSFLPSFDDHYRFDRLDSPLNLKISSEQALDMVMREYYPDLKKVYIPWTKENKGNYSELLFYEVSDYYYYQGTGGVLKHYMLNIRENAPGVFGAEHCVMFESYGKEEPRIFYIEDKQLAER